MKLIVDNGGTKALWVVIDQQKPLVETETPGMPPYFLKDEEIRNIILGAIPAFTDDIKEVHFYSTGCKAAENCRRFEDLFRRSFPNASKIEIATDILAAARALCQRKPGIACILGTGSNSCLYDGQQIIENKGGLGFILGDEGSGAALGKALVKSLLEKRLPKELVRLLEKDYNVVADHIIESVYQKPTPSRYLAQFAPFLSQNRQHAYISKLLEKEFEAFFHYGVLVYEKCKELPVHFTGSVALHFKGIIEEVGRRMGLTVGQFLANPIQGLVHYHCHNSLKL